MQKFRYLTVLSLLLLTSDIYAQDANYWNSQYNAGGYFLPGAVVSNNNDSGVLYINPALLANSKVALISANATIYHIDKIKIIDGAGNGFNLNFSNSGANSAFMAGNFRLPLAKKYISIAYGIIQSPTYTFASSQRRDEKANVLNDSYSPGPETFVGQYRRHNNGNDFKLVIAAGKKLTNRLSIGVTVEGVRQSREFDFNYYARALVNPEAGSALSMVGIDASYYVSYSNLSIIPKLGLAWEKSRDHFGLLITSPTLRIGGKGLLLTDNTINNLDITGTGQFPISLFGNTRQDRLSAILKAPLSIALGYTRDLPNGQLYLAAEYFGKLNEYNIITPRPEFFIRPDTGNSNLITPDLLRMKDARRDVLNVAVGANFKISGTYTFYVAGRTDFAYTKKDLFEDPAAGYLPNLSAWNIYHFQTGVNLRRVKYNLRAGVYTSFGRTKKYEQDINLSNPTEKNFLLGNSLYTKASYHSIGLMVSYIHNIK